MEFATWLTINVEDLINTMEGVQAASSLKNSSLVPTDRASLRARHVDIGSIGQRKAVRRSVNYVRLTILQMDGALLVVMVPL